MAIDLTGCIFYGDAETATTLSASDTATGPADGSIAADTQIGSWYDKNGGSITFSQATVGLRPYLRTGGLNSKRYLEFWDATNTPATGSGPRLQERTTTLHTSLQNSKTILLLVDKRVSAEGSYNYFFGNSDGGTKHYFYAKLSGKFTRFDSGSTATMGSGVHALAYTFAQTSGNLGVETIYVNSAIAAWSATNTLPAKNSTAFNIGDILTGTKSANSKIYKLVAFDRALSDVEIADWFAAWNTEYGTSFNTSVGPLTAGAISVSNVQKTTQTVSAAAASGGTVPYTYQWYRSTTNGTAASIAVVGNIVSGATSLTLNDTGLTTQTTYYYVLKVTDSAAGTVLSSVLTAPTHGPLTVKTAHIGDSITFGANSGTDPVTQFVLKMQELYPALDVQATNYGISGQKLRQYSRINHGSGTVGGGEITARITTMLAANITHVSIMEGVNDYVAGSPDYTKERYLVDMQDVVSALLAAGFTVYVNDMTYAGAGRDDPTTGLPAWNTQLGTLTYTGKLRRGDTATYGQMKAASPSELVDGVHLTTAGSTRLGQNWAAAQGASIYSDVNVTPTVPISPAGLSAQLTAGVITVAWIASSGATKYSVSRKVGVTTTLIDANYASTTFQDTGYTGAIPAQYIVSAGNTAGYSDPSTATVSSGGGTSTGGDSVGYISRAITMDTDFASGVAEGVVHELDGWVVLVTEENQIQRFRCGPGRPLIRAKKVLTFNPAFPNDVTKGTEGPFTGIRALYLPPT